MPNTPTTSLATIHGLAERVAAYRALDLLLFEVIGAWITDSTAANLRPYYAAWSQHHSWHADLWAGRFPVIPDLELETATERASERFTAVRAVFLASDANADTHTDAQRIRLLAAELLPQLEAILVEHRANVVPEFDAPTARVLDLVLDDVRRDAAMARQLVPTTDSDRDRPSPIDISTLFG
ncbi:hypothetical protein BH23ACT3_BH23ACT3_12220 [soil metagenome]